MKIKKFTILNLFAFVFILIASIFTLLPHQVQAGWTEQTSSGQRAWK
jgi:hypothetical protein